MVKKRKKQPPLKSRITSALRQVWRWSPERRAALERARVCRGSYECELCGHRSGPKGVQVNHKEPVVGVEGFQGWDIYIERLFCDIDGLEIVCSGCHKKETEKQRNARKTKRQLRVEK